MSTSPQPQKLNEQFGIPHTLRFEAGPGDLVRAVVTGEAAMSVIYLHGAHVAEYEPVGHKEVLFMSRASEYRANHPLRGGIPICFPWFGKKLTDPGAPLHGLARTRSWDVTAAHVDGDTVTLELATRIDAFDVSYRVSVGPELGLSLTVHNTGPIANNFEEALHTYFSVSNIHQVHLEGLQGATYLSKTEGGAQHVQHEEPLRITGETDRVYLNTPGTCVLHDPGFNRTITIARQHAHSTVVWNPWEAKAAAMPDFGAEEWPRMLCIETGNVADNAIRLEPGASHTMTTTLRVAHT